MRLPITGAALVVVALSFGGVPALADQPTEDLLKSWVEAIDASPDWTATFGQVSSHGDQTTLSAVAFDSTKTDAKLDIGTISVTGLTKADDGTLSAATADFDGVKFHAGTIDLDLSGVQLSDFAMPAVAFTWDRQHPLTALVPIMRLMDGLKIGSGTIGSMVLTQDVNGIVSETTYDGMTITNWVKGHIDEMKSGTVKTASPKKDPLVAISMSGVDSRDVDMNAIVHVLDPAQYAGGVGDRVWHTVVGRAGYHDINVTAAGVSATIASVDFENLRLRQPRGGIQALYDLSAGTPGGHSDTALPPMPDPLTMLDLLSTYGIGKIAMHDFNVDVPGVDTFHLGGFSISDMSSDGIGDFTIEDVKSSAAGQGDVGLGKFSFGGVVFPPIEAIVAAIKAQQSGGNVDVTSITPHLGYLEIDALKVALAAAPKTAIDSFRADFKNYVGAVPTAVTVDLKGADIPVDQLQDAQAEAMLTQLGYDHVRMNANIDFDWSAAGDLVFKTFNFAIDQLGAISGDLTLSGITPAGVDHLDPTTLPNQLSFVKGSLTFKDDSIVGRGIEMQAKQLKTDPAKFRQQFAVGIPLMLSFLGDPELQQELAPAIQTLVTTTAGSITATALPGAPVSLADLAAASESNPFAALKTLAVKFTSTPGQPLPDAGSAN